MLYYQRNHQIEPCMRIFSKSRVRTYFWISSENLFWNPSKNLFLNPEREPFMNPEWESIFESLMRNFFESRVRIYFWLKKENFFLNPEWEPIFESRVRNSFESQVRTFFNLTFQVQLDFQRCSKKMSLRKVTNRDIFATIWLLLGWKVDTSVTKILKQISNLQH